MKKPILLLSALLISLLVFAQAPQKMSYQTVIRNATDDLVSNSTVGIQISVLQGSAVGTAVYVETHAPITNANGLASLEIGGGTAVTGTMAAIDWGTGPYYVKSEVDPTGGTSYTLSVTSELLSVPYALHSGSSGTSQWSESGSGINTSNNVGINSVDPAYTLDVRSQSLADPAGLNVSNADRSRYLRLFSGSEEFPDPSMSWSPEHSLLFATFDDNTFDFQEKMRISSDGSITAPSMTNDLIESGGDRSLVTKEYVAMNSPSGLEAIDEGNGVGFRLIGRDSMNYGNIGRNAVDLSFSTSSSATRGATGDYSAAMGFRTVASGKYSTAMGINTEASGKYSTAMGIGTEASGEYSTAMGWATEASGNYSTTMGVATDAPSFAETAMGRFSSPYTPLDSAGWNDNDRLFVIGNGTFDNRSNALTVIKNGNIGIVTASPQAKLHISTGNDTGLGNNNGYLLLGQTSTKNISIDDNEIMAKNNGNPADLNLQIEGGNLKIGGPVYIGDETIVDGGNDALDFNAALLPALDNTNVLGSPSQRWTTVYATNGTINTSDRREKKNIEALDYGLAEVLQMHPVSFNWKNEKSPDLKLGLIAQDLITLIPEVVKSHAWEIDEVSGELSKTELERLGVYYSDLVPVLIKAIQEQQEMIDNQKVMIEELEGQSNVQAEALESNTALMKEMRAILYQESKK